MMMDEEMDSGNILAQKETLISQTENFGQLHDRLADQGSSLLIQTIEQITTGAMKSKKQDSSTATFAPRLTKEMGKINWCNSVSTICNLIRGLSPSPGAYSFLDGKMLKIYAAEPKPKKTDKKPGTIMEQSNKTISVVAIDGCIILREIQLAGKKKMPAEEFLRGYKINPETILGN
jgi:methionyl-tRNA formyltransferase